MRRFFVRVFASDRRTLAALQGYGLDLFRGTTVAARVAMRLRAAAVETQAVARTEPGEGGAPADSMGALQDMPWIDGLLTLEEIERLVVDGYRVLINEDADRRARARTETIEFEEWLKGMEGD